MIDKGLSKITCNDNLPRIVNAICITLVLLTLIYAIYSYLLTVLEAEKQPLKAELETIQRLLREEQKKQQLLAGEKETLSSQLKNKTEEINGLQVKLTKVKEIEQQAISQECLVEPEDMDTTLLQKALNKTLSQKSFERIEGFSILMNHVDYMSEQTQENVVKFYLQALDSRNSEGIYYATFVLSELKPVILQRYESELTEALQFIHEGDEWEKASHKYCKIESKMYDPLVGPEILVHKKGSD